MNFVLIMNFLTRSFVFFGIYHTFLPREMDRRLPLLMHWQQMPARHYWGPDLSFLLSCPQQLLPCYGTLAPLLHCTMLPLSTKSCLKPNKLRPILNGQFCHAISKNIGLYVFGSKGSFPLRICPLRGGVPPFSVKEKNLLFFTLIFR